MTQQQQQQQESTDTPITTSSSSLSSSVKRKAGGGSNVDTAFERLFGYSWGTTFALDDNNMTTTARQLVKIFGSTKAARILNVRGSISKRRRVEEPKEILNYKDIVLPEAAKSVAMEESVFAGQVIRTAKRTGGTDPSAMATKPAKAKSGNIDNVLAQLNGPSKMNTVQKTSNDWESFKETDKQLQEDLEKRAQGKDAYLVKQDFLNRVDNRKFEIEREERDRERAKRATS